MRSALVRSRPSQHSVAPALAAVAAAAAAPPQTYLSPPPTLQPSQTLPPSPPRSYNMRNAVKDEAAAAKLGPEDREKLEKAVKARALGEGFGRGF